MSNPVLPPANWYPDPQVPRQYRYWDGKEWTEHISPMDAPPANAGAVVVTSDPKPLAELADRLKEQRQELQSKHRRTKIATLEEAFNTLQLEPLREPLDEQIEVVGEQFYAKGIKKVFREAGLPITSDGVTLEDMRCVLVPEPWNPHDPNAVVVAVGRHQVGHLPADLAADYAEPLGHIVRNGFLVTGLARIWAKSDVGMIRARATILIPEVDILLD